MKKLTIVDPRKEPIQHTLPEVFIFESLSKKDEKEKKFEGQILSDMLKLAGKNPKYYYFQSEKELPYLLGLFKESRYRYLHISAHASETGIGTTGGTISYAKFADIFKGYLKLRRLFLSACQVGNKEFVDVVAANNKGMHSIVAPTEDIQFDHAAAIWSTFYISMFTENNRAMKRSDIEKRIKALTSLFPVDFFFASYSAAPKDEWHYQTVEKS